ncbi:MAG: hypothetical protein JRG91_17675 [Deltaproteobacteria bacterium]|nr:hypothetical protein [Deltaproteobacteria bacterium]
MKRRTFGLLLATLAVTLLACGPKQGVSGRLVNMSDYEGEEDDIDDLNAQVDQALASGKGTGDGGTTASAGTTTAPDPGTATKPKTKGTGPGQLIIKCKCLSEEVPCDVVVEDNTDLSKAGSGTDKSEYSFSLKAGVYKVHLRFHKAVNDPKLTLKNLAIDPGETVERVVNFPMAQVKFVPVKGSGKGKVGGWKLRIKLKGATDWDNNNVKLNEFVYMSPGLYEGQLYKGKKGNKTIDISSIQINEGAKSQVPIYVTH